jgi:hypothetical protein
VLTTALGTASVVFYDSDKNELYKGIFDEASMNIEVEDYG